MSTVNNETKIVKTDIDSKNGTRVRKLSQNAIMDVKLVGSVQLAAGDIIYIASTMLQLR